MFMQMAGRWLSFTEARRLSGRSEGRHPARRRGQYLKVSNRDYTLDCKSYRSIGAGFSFYCRWRWVSSRARCSVNASWLWFTAFAGVNLFQSGFTKFCPLDMILKRAGVRETC